MPVIRTLVVDDSAVVRKLVSDRIAADPDIEVVGTAPNASVALRRIEDLLPDVVILDDEMPDVRGREILKTIRERHPTTAVVMFSGNIHEGSLGTFDAVYLGADDGVAKPSARPGARPDEHPVWEELLRKARNAARRRTRGGTAIEVAEEDEREAATGTAPRGRVRARAQDHDGEEHEPAPEPDTARVAPPHRPPPTPGGLDDAVLVIGSSTGGPDALGVVLSRLPASFPLPVLVAQHMPPTFTRLLAERLDAKSALQVREAMGGETVRPGQVWIAPGDHHLTVRGDILERTLHLDQEAPEHSCRPAVDPLFRSAAALYGPRTLAVVLSGMGSDGTLGSEQVVAAGGSVFAQDEATSVVWSMPGHVVRAGLADDVLPIDNIPSVLVRRAASLSRTPRPASKATTR